MITKELLEGVLISLENGKRIKAHERTKEINEACSASAIFVQLCAEIFLHGLEHNVDTINTIAAGVIAGIDLGLKLAKKESEQCLTTKSQIN